MLGEDKPKLMNEYFQKGRPILVEGSLRFDSWEADDGTKRSRLKVRAFRFQFIGGPQDGDGDGAYDQASPGAAPASPGFSGEEGPSTTDDDIPF